MTKQSTKKILIIRFSSIGDIVLTTPVLRCIKMQLGAEVHFLTKKSFAPIISSNPHINKIFTIQQKVSEVLPQLRLEKYDTIIDLHKNLRSQQVRFALRVPYFSFDKINWEKWLMVNFKINRLPEKHIVERYLETVKSLGVKYDGAGLEPMPLSKVSGADNFFVKNDTPYIAFVIGGAHATKRLPLEKIISICSKIKKPLLLIGGKEDATVGEKIVLALKERDINNQCGKTNLEGSARWIKNAEQVITHDTGMMHLAAAYQKKIISIWGNTIPEFGMTPFYQDGVDRNVSIEVKNLSCRPCSKIGFDECPKGHFKCMRDIDEEQIVNLVERG